jgi:hypothetical protein
VRSLVGRIHPAWPALVLGATALLFRIWVTIHYHDDTVGHLVKGVPVYDGAHWDAMSADFGAGAPFSGLGPTGFDAMRPFRWIFMGAVYALTGRGVLVTQIVHALLGALGVVLTFEILRRITVLPIALLGAGYRAFSLTDARYGLTTASEPLGGFLSTLFLFLVIVAWRAERRSGAWWLGAGVVLGLTMLTRPEMLPLAIALPAALAILTWRRPHSPRRQRMLAALAFAGGITIVVGPWLVRQRVKYDIWQISFNAPDLLYSASSPRYGTWTSGVKALTIDKSIHDRVAFYSAGARQNLREHPWFYVNNVIAHTNRIARSLLSRWPLLVALGIVTLWALRSRRYVRVLVPAALLAVAISLVPEPMLAFLWLAAVGWALVRRAPMLLLGAFAVTPIVALGMTAMSGDYRMLYAMEWPVFTLAAWLIGIVVGVAEDADTRDWGRAGIIVRRIAAVAALLLVLGLGKALASRFAHHESHDPVTLQSADAQTWIARALDGPAGAAYASVGTRLEVREATVRPDYVMHFRAGERLNYWNPLFSQPRRYPFSVAEPIQEIYYVLPDGLTAPRGRAIFVGVPVTRPQFASSFEVIAIGAADGSILHPDEATARIHAAELPR